MALIEHMDDTIVALSTPMGVGALAVVRVSGSQSLEITQHFFRKKDGLRHHAIQPRRIVHGWFFDEGMHVVDEVQVVWYKPESSPTGEILVEVFCHGGYGVFDRILEEYLHQGIRKARPGEFTFRGFIHGKLDLIQAQAVHDLIHAPTALSTKGFSIGLQGGISVEIETLRHRLLTIAASIEVQLDYPEDLSEDDQSDMDLTRIKRDVGDMVMETDRMLRESDKMIRVRDGILTVIAGRPNVGKSSLMNRLLNEDRVLVSPEPGTTRDYIEETLNIKGVVIRLVDTAGIREGQESLERMGIQKSFEWLQRAELVLYLLDSQDTIQHKDLEILAHIRAKPHLIVLSKSDTIDGSNQERIDLWLQQLAPFGNILLVSALENKGLVDLEDAIVAQAQSLLPSDPVAALTLESHRDQMKEVRGIMDSLLMAIEESAPLDCLGDLLKKAVDHIDIMTGKRYSDDLIKTLFSQFCVGK